MGWKRGRGEEVCWGRMSGWHAWTRNSRLDLQQSPSFASQQSPSLASRFGYFRVSLQKDSLSFPLRSSLNWQLVSRLVWLRASPLACFLCFALLCLQGFALGWQMARKPWRLPFALGVLRLVGPLRFSSVVCLRCSSFRLVPSFSAVLLALLLF